MLLGAVACSSRWFCLVVQQLITAASAGCPWRCCGGLAIVIGLLGVRSASAQHVHKRVYDLAVNPLSMRESLTAAFK